MHWNSCRLLVVLTIFVALAATGMAAAGGGIIRLSGGEETTFEAMVADVPSAGIIFMGEVHNDAAHHRLQLQLLRALVERKEKVALGLEIFQADSQQALDDWSAGKLTEEEFRAVYAKNWTFDWNLYRDLLIYARDNRIPLVALNVPRGIASKVARQGFASLSAEERKQLPEGITCELKSSYTTLLQRAFGKIFSHVVKQSNFTNFCEAQSLRNSAMAWHLERYRQKHPERTILAVAGVWHAVKGGAPERLSTESRKGLRVILPEIPELTPQNTTVTEGDYLVRKGS
jgi:uncharacterized iron-regulated protein